MENIFVIGHKNPDTDTVCSAIVYAGLRGYVAAREGEVNAETAFALARFGAESPEKLESVAGKKVVLVDHNEYGQALAGIEEAEIVEVIDHHRVNFSHHTPIRVLIEPLGSTATVIARHYSEQVLENPVWSGLLLSALLSDTVVLKSPTTTETDRELATELARAAGVEDLVAYGIELKKANAAIGGKTAEELVRSDFKEFDFAGKKVGIGQVEVVDGAELSARRGEIATTLSALKDEGKYDFVALMGTDIIREETELFSAGDSAVVERAFGAAPLNGSLLLPGVMSRKKQVVPPLERAFAG